MTLLLDYDGTLVPIAPTPELAAPDAELLQLLARLAARPQLSLHIVSGRDRATLDRWFGHLPLTLWSEHGFWLRGWGSVWTACAEVPRRVLDAAAPILERVAKKTPGSFVEIKSASLAWHYRLADTDVAERGRRELAAGLAPLLRDSAAEMVLGKQVIEIRPRAANKGAVGLRVLQSNSSAGAVLAIGDDETDQDLFRALPDSAITIGVGNGPTLAKRQLPDPTAVRELLRGLIE